MERSTYDVVHAFTPILPRYPVRMIEACRHTPFVLGPVNGGLSFPGGFELVAKKEFDRFSFLRDFARFLPGYRRTYQRADKILAGSRATLRMLQKLHADTGGQIELLHENGVDLEFFADGVRPHPDGLLRLLFVGRLVPYKCADVVIEAVSLLAGEGFAGARLSRLWVTGRRGKVGKNRRAAWDSRDRCDLPDGCRKSRPSIFTASPIFCFPSVREFGGAVVLEAMAAGLPCIVADYGGIAEYVTEDTGFRIALDSREHLLRQMVFHIEALARNRELLAGMSVKAVARARGFTWDSKARRTVNIYENLIERKRAKDSPKLAERGSA